MGEGEGMSRPPLKALEQIKRYCEKTQCRRCAFGYEGTVRENYVECTLVETAPCDWDTAESEDKE